MQILKYIISSILLFFLFISCSSEGSSPAGNDTTMYNVIVNITPTDGGTVSPANEGTYEEGSTITLEAQGTDNYVFSGWSGDIESVENPLQITVDQNYNLTAGFSPEQYKLTVNKTGEGTVEENVVQAKTYEHGTVVELKATPGTGYEFIEWTGDLNSIDNPKTIVMDSPKTVDAIFDVKPTNAAVKIEVDWNVLDQSFTKTRHKDISDSVTHFGARLVYPVQNAVFMQSTEKVAADSLGVITMEVPAADSARLLVAAVRYENGNDKVYGFGVLEDLTIENGTAYNWDVDQITWSKPSWKVVDSLATDYENGTFTVSKDQTFFDMWYLVKTPYIMNPEAHYEDLIIKLNGSGGEGSYENGYREFKVVAENPTPGTANQEVYSFFPWLDSDKFNLPNARYVVEEKGSFTVSWE